MKKSKKKNYFTSDEWKKLEAHVKKQAKNKEYVEFVNPDDAKKHLLKRMKS